MKETLLVNESFHTTTTHQHMLHRSRNHSNHKIFRCEELKIQQKQLPATQNQPLQPVLIRRVFVPLNVENFMQQQVSSIRIVGTEEEEEPNRHTVYVIKTKCNLKTFTVKKRYVFITRFSSFEKLHTQLSSMKELQVSLPPKRTFRFTDSTIEERKLKLSFYLNSLLTHPDNCWRSSETFLTFLNIPQTTVKNSVKDVDEFRWMQMLEELKKYMKDIEIVLNQREQ